MKNSHEIFWQQAIKDYRFWIKFSLGFLQILSLVVFLVYSYVRLAKDSQTEQLLPAFYFVFVHLSYFPTLANLLCGIFFLHSAFHHHLEGKTKFDSDAVVKAVVCYVTLALLIYHISEVTKEKPYHFDYFVGWISLVCEHSLGPVVAIVYYIFFYNHENTKELKEFSKKNLWLLLLVPFCYGVFFWILGELSRIGYGFGLYYWNGAKQFGQGSHFPYPFLDFKHPAIFSKNISGALEAVVMLLIIFAFTIGVAYLYSWAAISIANSKWQKKLFVSHNKK